MRQVTLPARGTALLLIDVINDLAFAGSEAPIDQAEPMALRMAALKRRAAHAGIPVIYVNDNFGQWRSDFRHTVTHCTAISSPGHVVSRRLRRRHLRREVDENRTREPFSWALRPCLADPWPGESARNIKCAATANNGKRTFRRIEQLFLARAVLLSDSIARRASGLTRHG